MLLGHPVRGHGYRSGMRLRLEVESCRGCGKRRQFILKDVQPDTLLFECPACGRVAELRTRQMITLARRDQERLGRQVLDYILRHRIFGRWTTSVATGIRLRLEVPDCPGCHTRTSYWLKDVFDTGPLFACLDCSATWHVHLEEALAFALADQMDRGRSPSWLMNRTDRLMEPADRRRDEALGALREEALRRGYHPRELPWNAGR